MKKIYLSVILLLINISVFSQETLPYAYDFEGIFSTTGWRTYTNNDGADCFNSLLFGQSMDGYFGFTSGYRDFGDCGIDYRQYLVSPQLINSTSDSVQIRFKYKAAQPANTISYEAEKFVIGYYTGNQYVSVDDFVWLEDTIQTTNYTDWQTFVGNLPPTASYVAIAYTSDDASGLMIDDVVLRANTPGMAHLFEVIAEYGGIVSVTTDGVTTEGTTMVAEGADLTYTVSANPGYLIDTLWLDGIPNFAPLNNSSYTQTLATIIAPHELRVRFKQIRYVVTLDIAENGRIVPDGGATHQFNVPWDTTMGFRIYPDEGYFINFVAVNEERLWDNPDTITLANIRGNQLVQVTFAPRQYVVVAVAGEGGNIAPSDSVSVSGTQSAQFYISANPGYVIDSVFVDGTYFAAAHLQTAYVYTFQHVVTDHTISVTFLHQPYIVHYTATEHGILSVTGGVPVGLDSVSLYYEDTLTFNFVAEVGYELTDLQLNGVSVGVSNPYVLTHVMQNSTFHAVFEEKTFNIVSFAHNSGTITPSTTGSIGYFDTVRMVVAPNFCMQVDSILLDGAFLEITDTFCFTHLEGAHRLDAYFSQRYYTMQVQTAEHGTIVGNESVVCDGTARFKLLPDPCYQVAHFYWDGEQRDDLLRTVSDTVRVTIPNISSDHVVAATFEQLEYSVTVTSTGNGSVSPSSSVNVLCDSAVLVEAISNECHYVSSFTVNGADVMDAVQHFPAGQEGFGDTLRYELTGIRHNYSVSVEFRQFEFPLVVNVGPHGTSSITDTVWMVCGQDTTLQFVPDECYRVDSVLLDGEEVLQELVYHGDTVIFTLPNTHSSHELNVSFGLKQFTVSIASGENGAVVPNDDTLVGCDGSLSLVFVPASCYRVDTVWVDGVVINSYLYYRHNSDHHFGDSAFYTLNNITENHEVIASFRRMFYHHSISSVGNGTVASSVTGPYVYCGDAVTVTMTPDDCYHIKEVYLNDEQFTDYQVDENGVGTCYFPEADGDLNFSVEFEQIYYSISAIQQPDHGELVLPDAAVPCGNDVQLLFIPDECYHIDSVRIGDEWIQMENRIAVGDTFTYLIQNIHSDYVIDASFSMDSVHFIVSDGAPMSVMDTLLACGQTLTVFTLHEACTRLDSIRWNGQIYGLEDFPAGDVTYFSDTLCFILDPLQADGDIAVYFSQIVYAVNPHVSGAGRIEADSYSVACDSTLSIRIIPDDCHHLDGITVSNGCVYTLFGDTLLVLRNVQRDLDISFVFRTNRYEVSVTYNHHLGTVDGPTGVVPCGMDLLYTFTPANCAKLDSVFLDDILVNDLLDSTNRISLTIDSVSADHDLRVVFSNITYLVDVFTDEYSFVEADTHNIVDCGTRFVLAVKTDDCHYLSEVLLDGESIIDELIADENRFIYNLTNVRQNHSFEISTSQYVYPIVLNRLTGSGEILSSDTTYILCGKDTVLKATPFDECYKIDSVFLNDMQVEIQSEYICSSVTVPTTLNVYMHRISYRIEVTGYEHCSITEGEIAQMVLCDSSLHLAFVPDEGYQIIALVVDDEDLPAASFYDFLNVHENHTIAVKTEIYHYMVRTSAVGAGTVEPDSVAVDYGDNTELRFVPEECHYLSQLTVNGQSYLDSVDFQGENAILVLRRITSDQEVVATFAQLEYTVRSVAGEGGTIIPAISAVLCGETQQLNMIAADCYHLDTIFVNGVPKTEGWYPYNGDTLAFDLENVKEDFRIEATFAKDAKFITLENGAGGVAQLSDTTFLCGGGYSLQIIPDSCRTLEEVTINGVDIMPMLTYLENANPSLPDTAVYEVAGVQEDQQIQIVYGIEQPHHILVSFLSEGNVLSYNDIEIGCGEDTLVSLAYDCFALDSLLVDGIHTDAETDYQFTEVIANHTLEAYFSRNQYEITAIDAPHGSITPSGMTIVACGGNKTYLITPDEGYYIDSLIIDGEIIEAAASYTFTNVRANHTIEPIFMTYTYLIDVTAVGSGNVIPGDTVVAYGSSVHYDIVAEDCHAIDSVVVNGINRGSVSSYDFTEVTELQTLTAYFSQMEYTVRVGLSEHGQIVLDTTEVTCGGVVGFSVAPDACYALDSVLVNGLNVGDVTSYQIENIRENQVVDAFFSRISYSVIVDGSLQHGTVIPAAEQVLCGDNVTLSVQPDDCYSVDSLLVNGVNMGAGNTYVISEINEEQYITAYFSINKYSVEVLAGENGTVTGTGVNVVTCGEGFSVIITPDDCYQIGEVLVDGQQVEVQDNAVVLENVTSDHRVEVMFERIMYPQHVTAGFGGSVTPSAPSVSCGGSQLFVITPINCYHIDTVWVNGEVLPPDAMEFNGEIASFTLDDIRQINEIVAHFASNNYRFDVVNQGNGTVHLEQNSVECDGEATFYILPAACERISSVVLSGVDITENLDYHTNVNHLLPDTAFYTIDRMDEDKQLVIDYQDLPDNNVTIIYSDGTSTLYAADSLLACGENIRIDFNYDCYTVDSVILDGENQGAVNTLTVESNLSDRMVVAYFTLNVYDIAVTTTEGGRIEPDGSLAVACRDSRSVNIVPEACYSIDSVIVNGVNEGAITSYVFENIDENQTISAFFSRNSYTIELQESEGGNVTLDGSTTVACDGSVTISVMPETCFSIDSVVVNGVNVGNVISYTIENITEDKTVSAYFSRNVYEATSEAEAGGTIEPEGVSTLACGSEITYVVTPTACHQIDSVVVNGVNVGPVTSCTVAGTDELGDQTVRAYFSVLTYPVTLVAGEGGSVLPSEDTSVACGSSLNVSVLPDSCYRIDNVWIDGVESGALSSYTFENVTAPHTLSATFAPQEFTLTPITRGGGSVMPNVTTTVLCGSDFTFHFTPNAGYYVSGVVVDGDTLPAADSCLLTGIVANHTVQPIFSLSQFQITATAGEGGIVTPEQALVDYQGRQTIRIIAADCHRIDSVFVDGHYVGSAAVYTFNSVTGDHTLRAVFALNTYTLTASVEGNGTITPAGDTTVDCDESVTYSIAAAEGWHLAELRVDGETVEATDSYTFLHIRSNHTLSALFAIDEYTVTATAGEGGSVTPASTVVNHGDSLTIVITADNCHYIDSIFVDEAYVGTESSYTFRDITEDHTLRAVFATNTYTLTASVEGEGTIAPEGTTTVNCGNDAAYSFAPATGWHLTEVLVDGEPVDATDSYTFTNVRADHTITAHFVINEYTVTATAGDGGYVTPTSTVVNYGDTVTIEITADDCHRIDSVFVDDIYEGAVSSYTFRDIADDHTLRAVFAIDTYTLTASVEGEGTIAPEGATTVNCGDDAAYSFAPATGWYLTEVLVDGEPVDVTDSYTFTNVRADHTITAHFVINEYTVTAMAVDGGSVTPTSTVVNYGDTVTIEITADDCHHIDSVFVDDVYEGAVSSYTFRDIAEDHTLRAVFATDTYTLTASVEGEGTIAPEGTTTVNCGDDAAYTFAPATGWHLTEVLVDGEPVDVTDSYTFTNVRADHTITARFGLNEYTVTAMAGDGGSVTPTSTVVNYGDTVTIEITADDCYHIDSVFVDDVYEGAVSSYTFLDIADDHTLRAVFAQNVYDIRVMVVSEETEVFYDTLVNVLCGTDTLVGVPLFECFYVDSIDINGVMGYDEDSVLIQNVHEDMDIVFYLSREQFILVASKQGSGTVSPMDTVYAACDDAVTFTYTPDEGWYVENLIVDGESIGTPTNDSYTFYNIHEEHTIEVIFAPNVYIITSSIDPIDAGNISPYGQVPVTYGADQTFNIMPFPGYEVIDVEVDGVSQGAITTYTFHYVDANHTIVAHLMTVGVEESVVNEEISVWPNPVENVCHIQLPTMHNVEIQLFDAQGKLLLRNRVDANEVEIDFTGRPSGMYLLRVVSDGNVITTKKVIKK